MSARQQEQRLCTVLRTDPTTTTTFESLLGTTAVLLFVGSWLASLSSPLVLSLALFYGHRAVAATIACVTAVAYLPWEHGIISRGFQNFLNRYDALYYGGTGVSIAYEGCVENVDAATGKMRQTLYAVHPHGAFCIGWSFLYHNPRMIAGGVRFCFAPLLYASPIFRLFARAANRPGSASRSAMAGYMRDGEDVALPPGGFEEATLTHTSVDRVYVKRRYGFVKLCLKYGVSVRPVYVFGEGRLYSNVQGGWRVRLAMNGYNIPAIFPWGLWFFPLLPKKDVGLFIVVGRPLVLPKLANPTKMEVAMWHDNYVRELKRIYEDYKEEAYGSERGKVSKLEVW
jgi:hypothetical protein